MNKNIDTKAHNKTGYFKGDKVRFTGAKSYIYHGLFFEAIYLEGPNKDEKVSVCERLASLYF